MLAVFAASSTCSLAAFYQAFSLEQSYQLRDTAAASDSAD